MGHFAHLHTLEVGTKVGPDQLGTVVRVKSTLIDADQFELSHIINVKILVKSGP